MKATKVGVSESVGWAETRSPLFRYPSESTTTTLSSFVCLESVVRPGVVCGEVGGRLVMVGSVSGTKWNEVKSDPFSGRDTS